MFAKLSSNAARRIIGVALRNNTRAMELLRGYGWPSSATLDNNQTALHYAAWHGNVAAVRALLSRNAPVNVFEKEHGGTPLAWALHGSLNSWHRDTGDYVGVAKALLEARAKLPNRDGPLGATEEVLAVIREHKI